MKGNDLLTLSELTPADLRSILSLSSVLKKGRASGVGSKLLTRKAVAMIFEKPSTRTRVSFQVGISELGATPVVLSANEMQLGRGETIEDTARVLSRYVHAIVARVNRHSDIITLADASSVPVVNGLSDLHHPVQILADLLTLQEEKGKLKGLRVAWVGDGDNVCNSWAYGAALSGIEFVAATPDGYGPDPTTVMEASKISASTGGSITLTSDPEKAVKRADCVITDTFVSMGLDAEKAERVKTFLPRYRVDSHLMGLAKPKAIFQHCLPAHRGEEVTPEVIDGRQSVVFQEAENRLHTQKALLCTLLAKKAELAGLVSR